MRGLSCFLIVLSAICGCRNATDPLPVPGIPERPHLVFYMLDGARADFAGAEETDGNMPSLARLAAEGVQFTRHFSHAKDTNGSLPQLFTGSLTAPAMLRFVEGRRAWWFRDEISRPDGVMLTTLLANAGYRTVMITAHPWTTPGSQFGEAFDEVVVVSPGPGQAYADAARVFAAAEGALRQHRGEGRIAPLFVYIHLLDTHAPHLARPRDLEALGWNQREWLKKRPRSYAPSTPPEVVETYRNAARDSYSFLDHELGKFQAAVNEHLGGQILQVITSDHGDGFGEGGWFDHPLGVFGLDSLHHIPLVITGKGLVPAGRVVRITTETVDVLPTIAQLLDIPLPRRADIDGISLIRTWGEGPLSSSVRGVRFTQRLGWQVSRLGYRGAEGTWLLLEDGRIYLSRDRVEFELVGRWDQAKPDGLPAAFESFVEAHWRAAFRRTIEPRGESMLVPRPDLVIDSAECWELGDWRFLPDPRYVGSPRGCEPLRASITVPAGSYRIRWSVQSGETPPHLRVELPRHHRVVRSSDETWRTGSLDLGGIEHAGGRLEFEVHVEEPSHVVLSGLQLRREGMTIGSPPPQVDPELIKQLESLGYLQ